MIKISNEKAMGSILCHATHEYAFVFQYMREVVWVAVVSKERIYEKHKSDFLFIKMKKVLNVRKEFEK